jgi:hypothetical protein
VVTPGGALHDVVWGAAPSLLERPVTIAPTLHRWLTDGGIADLSSIRLIGGPGLEISGVELEHLANTWQATGAANPRATRSVATESLESADLLHIAAHGSFRSDNPFFSSILFEDGHLTVLEMADLARVPDVVVLSSCDAGAAGSPGAARDAVIGTAHELRQLGAKAVVAPVVTVNDRAAFAYSTRLHGGLAAGRSIDAAAVDARLALAGSGDPRQVAAAHAFQVFGGRCTRAPLTVRVAD